MSTFFNNYVNGIIVVCITWRRRDSSRYNRIVTSNDACRKERDADKNVTSRSIIRGCFLAATKTALSIVRVLGTERPVADFALLLYCKILSFLSVSLLYMITVCQKFLDTICSLIKKLSKYFKSKNIYLNKLKKKIYIYIHTYIYIYIYIYT